MKQCYCLRGYHSYGTTALDTFMSQVRNGIYNNPTIFTTPPVSPVIFDTMQANFSNAAADYKVFGITKKTVFLLARQEVEDMLDNSSSYVDTVAGGDISLISLAGYKPSREQFQRSLPIDKIAVFDAKPTAVSGQVAIEIPTIINRGPVHYSCVCVEGAPLTNAQLINGQLVLDASDPKIHQDFNKSRRKLFQSLTPGVQYFFYVYATNSVNVSPLSDVKSMWVS